MDGLCGIARLFVPGYGTHHIAPFVILVVIRLGCQADLPQSDLYSSLEL